MLRSSNKLYWILTGTQIAMFAATIFFAVFDGHPDLLALGFLCIAFGITLLRAAMYAAIIAKIKRPQKGS